MLGNVIGCRGVRNYGDWFCFDLWEERIKIGVFKGCFFFFVLYRGVVY